MIKLSDSVNLFNKISVIVLALTEHQHSFPPPVAVYEHEILSRDDGLKLPDCEQISAVLLKDTIYLGVSRAIASILLAPQGQILSYSLTERS